MRTTALAPMGSAAPLSPTWTQSSSALSPFLMASSTTFWAVTPGGSDSTTNSCLIGNASSLMNVTSIGWFAGTVGGMPTKVKFLTETLYMGPAGAAVAWTAAATEAVNGAIMPRATCGGPVPPPALPVSQEVAT